MSTLPNFVLIMTDQQRFDQVGYASASYYETPNLDALAREGVIFANAYSGSTTCVPARASLLTGVHHHRLPTQVNRLALREGFWTVAHALRQVGYETALIGKMHFAPVRAQHGFGTSRLCEHLGAEQLAAESGLRHEDVDDYHQALIAQGLPDWRARARERSGGAQPERSGRPFPYPARFHPTEWVKQEALSLLRHRDPGRPLMAIISFPHPHAPYNPPPPYDEMYDFGEAFLPSEGFGVNDGLPPAFREALRSTQGIFPPYHLDGHEQQARHWLTSVRQLIRQLDDAIGAILHEIDLSRTLVLFTSDHGDFAGHRGMLKKVPWIPFDDLARVPLVIAGQGVCGGRRLTALVQNCDFAATCVDYAGLDLATELFDTRSLRPLLAEDPGPRERERSILCATSAGWPMIRRANLKYVMEERSSSAVLFDLAQDPGETRNVLASARYRQEAEEMSHILRRELSRGMAELPVAPGNGHGGPRARQLNVPARFVRGAFDHDESVQSACWLIRHISEHLGLEDFSASEVLDFGCGVKFSEAFVNGSLPIKRYVGCDVYGDMIKFLQENVNDGRLEYVHIDAHNAMYNPTGEQLTTDVELPIDGQTFDLIVLLSVFTHLGPSDYRTMLTLLRRFANADTRLFYSLYIDELTAGGHGLMDRWDRTLSEAGEKVATAVEQSMDQKTGARPVATFKDLDPGSPLRWAVYSKEYASQLIRGTGWRVVSLSPPDRYIQHHFVCEPC